MEKVVAKYNDRDVVVTYVTAGLTWALVSYDIQNQTKKFKVDVIELTDVSEHDLYELQANIIQNPSLRGRI